VTEQRVSLHLSETDASVFLTTFHGLTRDGGDGTGRTHLRFVTYHVSVKVTINAEKGKNEGERKCILCFVVSLPENMDTGYMKLKID